METLTERLENQAALLLLAEDRYLRPEAAENLLDAIALGLLQLGSVTEERKYIAQSVSAGRQLITPAQEKGVA